MHPVLASSAAGAPLSASGVTGPSTTEALEDPVLAAELNDRWAAARLPFRLDRRGVAQLWAVCAAGADMQPPLLFIVGSERRAVHQAQRWADLAWPRAAPTLV